MVKDARSVDAAHRSKVPVEGTHLARRHSPRDPSRYGTYRSPNPPSHPSDNRGTESSVRATERANPGDRPARDRRTVRKHRAWWRAKRFGVIPGAPAWAGVGRC